MDPRCPQRVACDDVDLAGKRLLIFVVAYNAEATIEKVLTRIPRSLHTHEVEVLIIDDSSQDGGNQKLGYRYAIDNNFDFVALIHGDGQYAPEKLPQLLAPLVRGQADAVLGSRMIDKWAALRGGMPLYKWIGNQILTTIQNRMLRMNLSEFHSGYRLYSTKALAQIPFEKNTNDFHFDTEIIIQFALKGLRIVELPIPTFYGDEICHVNGLKYAGNIFKTTLRARLHQLGLFFDRKFDVDPPEQTYDLKLGYESSHEAAIAAARPGGHILDVGCGQGYVAAEIKSSVTDMRSTTTSILWRSFTGMVNMRRKNCRSC